MTVRWLCLATHKGWPQLSQRSLSGVSVFSCVAWGRGFRRAISLLLLQKASFTTSVYASCQPKIAIQQKTRMANLGCTGVALKPRDRHQGRGENGADADEIPGDT